MPTYDYRCPEGHIFELFQRMSDPPPEACEVCNAAPVERVLFPVAVHFKGSGFYSTDYGRGNKRDTTKDRDGSSSETKKDDKAAATSSTPSSDSSPPASSPSGD